MEIAAQSIVASRYRVLRELGRGAMGVVYEVEHLHTGDRLAMKLLIGTAGAQAELVERFKREARASSRIKSEHVVKVTDADTAPELGGAPYLVMELLNGSDLEKILNTQGRFAPEEVVRLLTQAARALDKSHSIGIIHRDLKPENLFLHRRDDGETMLKIVDFGISKLIDGNADMAGAGMTKTGAVMGTPLYMSPEQARGQTNLIGPHTDIWAIGLIVIHLLSGEIYWRANTIAELMVNILAEPLYEPSKRWPFLPPAIDAWFARSCDRDPSKRWPTVGAQADALAIALGGAPSQERVPRPIESAPRVVVDGNLHTTENALARSGVSVPKSSFPLALLLFPFAVIAGLSLFAYRRHVEANAAPVTSSEVANTQPSTSIATSAAPAVSTPAVAALPATTATSSAATQASSATSAPHASTHVSHSTHPAASVSSSAPQPQTSAAAPAATAGKPASSSSRLMPVAP